jgi:ParB family chromosome partitioning protein
MKNMSKPQQDRKALGKGLSALLPSKQGPRSQPEPPHASEIPHHHASVYQISIDRIDPNPVQPRSIFQPERLSELAQSIRTNGIIQPLVVQRAGERYQLVAGERRWRAAKLAGLPTVPAVVQEFAKDRLLEIALIENIQREDLNPIEVAHALDRLATEYGLSHEEIGQRTGKERATVSNFIRLLKLPKEVQLLLAENRLTMGHAKAILGLPSPDDQVDIAEKIAAQGMSVRQAERLMQSLTAKRAPEESTAPTITEDPNVAAAMRELEAALGTRVRIVPHSANRGKIEIDYFSSDELDRLYNHILGNGK